MLILRYLSLLSFDSPQKFVFSLKCLAVGGCVFNYMPNTFFLCVICILTGAQAFRKKRYGLSALLWLNAFTNLVNSIHAFYMNLF